jgi:hypothetical protein
MKLPGFGPSLSLPFGSAEMFQFVNSSTAIGTYLAHRFSWASIKVNNFSIFYPLTTFNSSKCS